MKRMQLSKSFLQQPGMDPKKFSIDELVNKLASYERHLKAQSEKQRHSRIVKQYYDPVIGGYVVEDA